jgi:hypothetical protein
MVVGVVPLLIVGVYLFSRKSSDKIPVKEPLKLGSQLAAEQNGDEGTRSRNSGLIALAAERFGKLTSFAPERTKDGKDKKKRKMKVFDLITEIEKGAKKMRNLRDKKKNGEANKLLLTLKNKFNQIKEEERNQLNGILQKVKYKKDEYSDFKELEEEWHKFVNERVFWHSGRPGNDGNGRDEVINLFEQFRTPKLRDSDVFKVKK